MITQVRMPQAETSLQEGTIARWLVKEGEAVTQGQSLLEVETDKATIEVETPADGTVRKLLFPEGTVVPINETIAVIADPDEDISEITDKALSPAAHEAAVTPPESVIEPTDTATRDIEDAAVATPAARRLARAKGIDLNEINGSGKGRRILETDVNAYLKSKARKSTPVADRPENAETKVMPHRLFTSPAARRVAAETGVDLRRISGTGPGGRIQQADVLVFAEAAAGAPTAPPALEAKTVELSRMRRAIANNLVHSKQNIPHFYLTIEVDSTTLYGVYEERKQVDDISVNDFVLKAVSLALCEFPDINSQFDGDVQVYKADVNIGIAVSVEEGLRIPVLLKADKMPLSDLVVNARELAAKARAGKVVGAGKGTFTVTNLGMFGITEFAAVINPPEAGILAVGKVSEALAVEDGAIRIGKSMKLTLSGDHRAYDGVTGAKFLARIKELLENPRSLTG